MGTHFVPALGTRTKWYVGLLHRGGPRCAACRHQGRGCGSAAGRGVRHTTSATRGAGRDSGSASSGWPCLSVASRSFTDRAARPVSTSDHGNYASCPAPATPAQGLEHEPARHLRRDTVIIDLVTLRIFAWIGTSVESLPRRCRCATACAVESFSASGFFLTVVQVGLQPGVGVLQVQHHCHAGQVQAGCDQMGNPAQSFQVFAAVAASPSAGRTGSSRPLRS